MAFNNYENRPENSKQTGMGIGPHDYALYTYGTGGGTSSENLVRIDYFVGGQQGSGELVGTIVFTYNSQDNIISSERTA